MRDSYLPREMTRKAKLYETTLPVDKYIELHILALKASMETDEEKITDLIRRYREILENLTQ